MSFYYQLGLKIEYILQHNHQQTNSQMVYFEIDTLISNGSYYFPILIIHDIQHGNSQS